MLNFGYKQALSESALKPPVFLTSIFVFLSAEKGRATSREGFAGGPDQASACAFWDATIAVGLPQSAWKCPLFRPTASSALVCCAKRQTNWKRIMAIGPTSGLPSLSEDDDTLGTRLTFRAGR